jgi:hypothetical protein
LLFLNHSNLIKCCFQMYVLLEMASVLCLSLWSKNDLGEISRKSLFINNALFSLFPSNPQLFVVMMFLKVIFVGFDIIFVVFCDIPYDICFSESICPFLPISTFSSYSWPLIFILSSAALNMERWSSSTIFSSLFIFRSQFLAFRLPYNIS